MYVYVCECGGGCVGTTMSSDFMPKHLNDRKRKSTVLMASSRSANVNTLLCCPTHGSPGVPQCPEHCSGYATSHEPSGDSDRDGGRGEGWRGEVKGHNLLAYSERGKGRVCSCV